MPHSRIPPATAEFVDASRVDTLLEPILPDADDRAFVVRCILGEGPVHHRGANYVLLMLLGTVLDKISDQEIAALRQRGTVPVAMRVPPNLTRPGSLMSYPLNLPIAPLERLAPAGSAELSAMAECLMDGPPQHALANATMMWLIGIALDRITPPK